MANLPQRARSKSAQQDMGGATGRAICSKCGREKRVDEFYKRNDRPSGHTSRCIDCIRGGKKCADCGKPISYKATYCLNCRFKGDRNPIAGTERPDHVKEALREAQRGVPEKRRGEQHHSWKGDAATPSSGRRRANEMYEKPECCESYCRLARWRVHESGHGRKALARTWAERQEGLAL